MPTAFLRRRRRSILCWPMALIGLAGCAGLPSAQTVGEDSPRSAISLISASLRTCDLSRSIEFYTEVIGLRSLRRLDTATQNKARLDFPEGGAGLLLIAEKDPEVPCRITDRGRINVDVSDIRAIDEQLGSKGGRMEVPIGESREYGLLYAVALDPDGNEIEMIQRWKRPHRVGCSCQRAQPVRSKTRRCAAIGGSYRDADQRDDSPGYLALRLRSKIQFRQA